MPQDIFEHAPAESGKESGSNGVDVALSPTAPTPPVKKRGRPSIANPKPGSLRARLMRARHGARYKSKQHTRYEHYRIEAMTRIAGYGPVVCVRCGCDDLRVLQVNHKLGGGNREAKAVKGGLMRLYLDVYQKRRGVDDLEILCQPCNHVHAVELRCPDLVGRFKVNWTPGPPEPDPLGILTA